MGSISLELLETMSKPIYWSYVLFIIIFLKFGIQDVSWNMKFVSIYIVNKQHILTNLLMMIAETYMKMYYQRNVLLIAIKISHESQNTIFCFIVHTSFDAFNYITDAKYTYNKNNWFILATLFFHFIYFLFENNFFVYRYDRFSNQKSLFLLILHNK